MRHRFVATLSASMLLVLALTLSGCGGGDQAGQQPTGDTGASGGATGGATGGAAPQATAPAGGATSDLSPKEPVSSGETLPLKPEATPEAVEKAVQARQPLLLFFYEGTSGVTSDQKAEVDAAVKKYRGLIDVVSYDVSLPTDTGDSAGQEQQKAILFATQLNVKTTPYIIITDPDGLISARFRGFVDAQLIEREILRATQ